MNHCLSYLAHRMDDGSDEEIVIGKKGVAALERRRRRLQNRRSKASERGSSKAVARLDRKIAETTQAINKEGDPSNSGASKKTYMEKYGPALGFTALGAGLVAAAISLSR